jgi:hypothetical protein
VLFQGLCADLLLRVLIEVEEDTRAGATPTTPLISLKYSFHLLAALCIQHPLLWSNSHINLIAVR